MRRKFIMMFILVLFSACSHERHAKYANMAHETDGQTIGYLRLKTQYSKAALDEGGVEAIRKALSHKHIKTGKPYPYWNALSPYKKKNLPVSLSLSNENEMKEFFQLAKLDVSKLDGLGKDGTFSYESPLAGSGYQIWKFTKTFKKLPINKFSRDVIVLLDISGSMQAKKKLNTMRGLAEANTKFKKVLGFAGKGSLREIFQTNLLSIVPSGYTALYETLKLASDEYPNDEIIVITDGRDNRSKIKIDDLLFMLSKRGKGIHILLTGGNVRNDILKVAYATNGQVMSDFDETGYILEPQIETVVEK